MGSQRPFKAADTGRRTARSSRAAGGRAESDLLNVRRYDEPGPRTGRASALEAAVLAGAAARPGQHLVDLSQPTLVPAALQAVSPGGSVTVLNPTREALAQVRPTPDNGNVWGSLWDVTGLPLPDGSADAVVGRSMLAPLRHPRRMLIDITRVLKPGGRLSTCELLLGQRPPIDLDELSARDLAQAAKALADVQPAAYAFTTPSAVGNARLAGLAQVDYVADEVTSRLSGAPAADLVLHAKGPAGESVYQAISRTLGADFARRYADAWRSTARRRPVVVTTPIVYITAVKPDTRT